MMAHGKEDGNFPTANTSQIPKANMDVHLRNLIVENERLRKELDDTRRSTWLTMPPECEPLITGILPTNALDVASGTTD